MRQANKDQLLAACRQLRVQSYACIDAIDESTARVPQLDIVNLPVWELGHIGWVQEHWCLRYREGKRARDSIFPNADALFDSAAIAHAARWSLPLPNLVQTRAYLDQVFDLAQEQLSRSDNSNESLYFHRLCYFHEAMHLEAFYYTWQTLGFSKPEMLSLPSVAAPTAGALDLHFAGGEIELGSQPGQGFVFDNEKWAQLVRVAPFAIAREAVTYGQFADFVSAGGYHDPHWWDAWYWNLLQAEGRSLPTYWSAEQGGAQAEPYLIRRFDQMIALPSHEPVKHVSAYEAQAYCAWAGRRLPSEAEWVFAVQAAAEPRAHQPMQWGDSVWEWTASNFSPLPGFSADPYKEYSQPWFGDHRVVRGGSFATPRDLVDPRFRNFYLPQRADPFLGFRTCAV